MIPHSSFGANRSDIKTQNISAILLTLLHNGGVSRVHLSQQIGVSTATITNLINELSDLGIVTEEGVIKTDEPQIGRPQRALQLVAGARYAIGVHIDVGYVRVAVTDLFGEPLQTSNFQHDLDQSWQATLDEAVAVAFEQIEQTGISFKQIVGVGVAASGLVDPYSGVNVFAPNLGWRDAPIREYLTERLNLPVVVENNVRAMALGESLFGLAQDVHALAFVYARVGVGAGLVVGGQLYRGAGAGAGEIGHTTVALDGGVPCYCGNTGCLETFVSEPAFIREAQELAAHNPDSILAGHLGRDGKPPLQLIFDAAHDGDIHAEKMLEERGRYMGVALANLVNVFNPEMIVLGGIFTQEPDILLPAIEQTMRQRAFANLGENVALRTTKFGAKAGMIGAAALALDAFLYRPQYRFGELHQSLKIVR
jgi:glucokinase-like ROK family protein